MNRSLLLSLVALMPACFSSSSTTTPPVATPTDGGAGNDTGSSSADGGTQHDAAVVNECPKPTGGPTEHPSSIQDEVWTADKSPHILPYDTSILGTLTLEPCAEVLLGERKTVTITATGKIVGEGIANNPIHIGAMDPAKPFAQIRAINGGTLRLAHATVDGGGHPLNTNLDLTGTIYAQGSDQYAPSQETIFVDHVTIAGSKSNGLFLADGAGFANGSQELTVTGAAQYPMSIWARAVGGVPSGHYAGNAVDEIVLPANAGAEAVQEDTTMHNRGVPYRAGNSGSLSTLTIERQAPSSPGLATLTIEAGVKIRVKKGGVIRVQRFVGATPAQGALVVNGTLEQPVIFTSAEDNPAPGDWLGIWFGLVPAANDKINYARIEYAGGLSASGSDACNTPGTNDAAIRIFGPPASAFVTNTVIENSAGHGIDRGWRDDSKVDFMVTNDFKTVAKCKQSYPKDTNGACPTPVPCP